MGTYLNPGKAAFEEAVNSEIFVDKTTMILYLNSVVKTKQKYVSVSRPRRFGKTMAADMICAYYGKAMGSRDLFAKRKLADAVFSKNGERCWDKYLGQFDVLRLVMTDFMDGCNSVQEMLGYLTEEVVGELMENYPDVKIGSRINLRTAMSKIFGKTDRQFVVVIDEWDVVFRTWQDDLDGQTKYLDFLRDWMKDKPYIALAYMTGILPIKKYGKHSALNMFTEYSVMFPRQLAPYTGFTTEEVRNLCRLYGRNIESIRDWYDGYEISDVIPPDPDHKELRQTGQSPKAARYSIYSPLSVVEAMTTGYIRDYWNATENYEALAEYIRKDYGGLKDAVALLMDGGRVKVDTSTYQNDMTTFHSRDDVLSLLIHLGYLSYDLEKSEASIPNEEIRREFIRSIRHGKREELAALVRNSDSLLRAVLEGDEARVAEAVAGVHETGVAPLYYNDEQSLRYVIRFAFLSAVDEYVRIEELPSGRGYADGRSTLQPQPPHPSQLPVHPPFQSSSLTSPVITSRRIRFTLSIMAENSFRPFFRAATFLLAFMASSA